MIQGVVSLLSEPAIILGFVALLGVLVQREDLTNIVKGTTKTVLGTLILTAGTTLIAENLEPFSEMFTSAFNVSGVVPVDEAVVADLIANVAEIGRMTSFILLFGFVINILLARITPFKYIFLTGHMLWITAGFLAWAFHDLGVSEIKGVIFGSIIAGMLFVILPALAQPIVRKVTGNNQLAYSHLTTTGVVVSAYIGKLVGNREKDSEDIKLPEQLNFFKDTAVSVSLVMLIIYLIAALVAVASVVGEFAEGQNYLVFSFFEALGFAAGVLILLEGVRMFLGESVPAFRGIAIKLVPGAKPALDAPIFFR